MPSQPSVKSANQTPAPYTFNPEILREYDIRGQVGKTLSEADAYAVGLAYGTYVRRKGADKKDICRIAVGYDGRTSSPALEQAVVAGLTATGIQVERIGRGPTPMLYFAVKDLKTDAGIMITGSHNPPDHNGFKMTLQSASVFGEAVQELGRIAAKGDYEAGKGTVKDVAVEDNYVARLLKDYRTDGRPLTMIWDCGNGAAGDVVRKLTAKLPGKHTLMYDDIDGTFPNHHPDPTVDANLADLIAAVKKNKADLGVAFDGDADRVGAVDETGRGAALRQPDRHLCERRAEPPQGRADHRRRQMQPGHVRRNRPSWRPAGDVEDRPLPHQNENGRTERAAGGGNCPAISSSATSGTASMTAFIARSA